jgi:hypothetical protein
MPTSKPVNIDVSTADCDRDKWQIRPLVREGAPRRQNYNCLTVTKIWSWAPDGAWHQDWPSVVIWFWLDSAYLGVTRHLKLCTDRETSPDTCPWGDVYSGEIKINSITLRETCLMNYKRIKPYICREIYIYRYIDFVIKELVAMLPAIIARSVHTLRLMYKAHTNTRLAFCVKQTAHWSKCLPILYTSPLGSILTYASPAWDYAAETHINKNKKFWEELIGYFPWYDTGHIANDASNNSSTVSCVFVTAATFLPSRCLATIGRLFA